MAKQVAPDDIEVIGENWDDQHIFSVLSATSRRILVIPTQLWEKVNLIIYTIGELVEKGFQPWRLTPRLASTLGIAA